LVETSVLAANSGALDAALFCASLDIVDHELRGLNVCVCTRRFSVDWQTITILDAVLNGMMDVKHRLTELMGRYVHLDTECEPESNPAPGGHLRRLRVARCTGCKPLTTSARKLHH
jgi:hypothetical protein